MTNSAVLSAIEVNLSEWLANIPKQPAVDLGGDGEEPTRRSPHYSVVVVNSRVGGCGVCGKGQQCTVCNTACVLLCGVVIVYRVAFQRQA